MNTNNTNPQNNPAAELRRAAVLEMLKGIKETFLLMHSPSPMDGEGSEQRGDAVERAARVLATLKLAKHGLETFPIDKHVERALRSAERAIQEQEKWLTECERRQR